MIKYGKLINGLIEFAPNKIKDKENIIYNPSYEMLQSLGYLPIKFTEAPITDDSHSAVCVWSEIDNEIIQNWNIIEAEPPVEYLFNILIGENEND